MRAALTWILGFSECGGYKGGGTRKPTTSDGLGGWAGKEVKG